MSNKFKKLMREQVQESLNKFIGLTEKPVPKKGWIRTIREALGMSSYVLANRLGVPVLILLRLNNVKKKELLA